MRISGNVEIAGKSVRVIGLLAVVDDTAPVLGGDLDCNFHNILNAASVELDDNGGTPTRIKHNPVRLANGPTTTPTFGRIPTGYTTAAAGWLEGTLTQGGVAARSIIQPYWILT